MPVSKKRKKDGRPVRPHAPPSPEAEGHAEAGEHAPPAGARPPALRERMGAPRNPFVAQQNQRRGAQRGR